MRIALASLTALLWFPAAASAGPIELTQEAVELTQDALLIDGHNDLPWALREAGDMDLERFDLRKSQSKFHTDIPKFRHGGLDAQFWSVYVPASSMDSGNSYEMTLEQIDLAKRLTAKYPETFGLAYSTEEIRQLKREGKIASLIGVEGGHSIENSLRKLDDLYERGARYMTITHSRSLSWADSATDESRAAGLSQFGRSVIRRMNELGMLIDISHVSETTMNAILDVTEAPVIASHSSAYAITEHVRNVPDDVLRRVAENGGVVMVNFFSRFIVPTDTKDRRGDAEMVVRHIDHIAQVAGVDHVGIGSDYDGVPLLPRQLGDASKFPYVTQGLLDLGYTKADIRKILGGNVMRAFAEAEAIAAR